MGTSVPAVRGGGAFAAALVALALVFSPGSRALAADLTATSGNGLNVTGAAASSFLPQGYTPPAAAPERSWLEGFHMSGYLSQQFGMW
jgi:hypothetical protein